MVGAMAEAMARESDEYVEGVKKVLFPAIFGVVAGILSFLLTEPASGDGLLIAMILIIVQRYVYPLIHLNISAKDFPYISFITVFSWFIAFTLLLNA